MDNQEKLATLTQDEGKIKNKTTQNISNRSNLYRNTIFSEEHITFNSE
jgi:hypothetical protein